MGWVKWPTHIISVNWEVGDKKIKVGDQPGKKVSEALS
jgi:hypothetical protein